MPELYFLMTTRLTRCLWRTNIDMRFERALWTRRTLYSKFLTVYFLFACKELWLFTFGWERGLFENLSLEVDQTCFDDWICDSAPCDSQVTPSALPTNALPSRTTWHSLSSKVAQRSDRAFAWKEKPSSGASGFCSAAAKAAPSRWLPRRTESRVPHRRQWGTGSGRERWVANGRGEGTGTTSWKSSLMSSAGTRPARNLGSSSHRHRCANMHVNAT